MTTLLSNPPSDDSTRALRKSGDHSNSTGTSPSLLNVPPPPAPPAANEPSPSRRLLSYELGEKIGAGGMGTVYRAKHAWLGRTVAIKFISPEVLGDPEAVGRFAQEARAIGSLDHPNVVRALDAGCVEGVHYLVTEFVEGCDLQQVIKRRGPLDVASACEAIRQAALGLQHAHERGLVHRDVKPSNLRLDRQGNIKLLDFGVARLNNGHTTMTSTGQMIGTLDYLAPEQASNPRGVDGRADIYSLGCTLYFLLTGEPPFSGPAYDTPASKIKGHMIDPPAELIGSRCRNLPRGVATVIERMMAKDPGDRYRTPLEVVVALSAYCRGASLAALADANLDYVSADVAQTPKTSFTSSAFSVLGRMAWALPMLLIWLFRGSSGRRSSPGFHVAPKPLMSFTGLLGIGMLIYIFTNFIRVERPNGSEPPKTIVIPIESAPPSYVPVSVPAPTQAPSSTPAKISNPTLKPNEPVGITNKFAVPKPRREESNSKRFQ